MNRRALPIVAAACLAAAPLSAQTLTLGPLVQGQPFVLSAAGAVPPADAAYLLGLGGLGAGTCFTPTFCLDLLDPWALLAILPTDAAGATQLPGVVPPLFPLVEIDVQVAFVSYAGGAVALSKTNALARTVQTLGAFSDGFDAPTLDPAWRVHEPGEMLPPVLFGSALYLQPTATGAAATWFQNEEGPGLFKPVTGDFTVSAVLHVSNPAAASPIPVPPPISYRLAGLLARDPASAPGSRNSVHVALGAGDAATPLAVEDKTTQNSSSVFQLHATPSHHAELRLQRVGATFTMSWRPVTGGAWNVVATHVRPDLPATLEVGPMAYSNSAPAFILAQFDDVTFGP
jgi:hypothetical protein